MKASELRIGNWIVAKDFNKPFQVAANTFTDMIQRFIANEQIHQPIPLTEEWLLRFGFIKDDPKWFRKPNTFPYICCNLKGEAALEYNTDFIVPATQIKYVHQLQNLYFALTGEELTIKE